VNCPACGHENREGARFCGECTAPLVHEIECPGCGTANPASQKFCDHCTHPLRGGSAPPPRPEPSSARDPRAYTPKHLADKILQSRSALEGERKQVTVFFADVKGSMELASELDPEEWHRILDGFFQILSDGVHRFEGRVNQYTGDGIMALFGAPIAHEDHAQRACYAALWLRDELRGYADELKRTRGIGLSVRIGLNSGEVVVGKIGDDLRMDYTAQGHTVGLAQRMEQLADPGSTYLTEHTAALVGGFFDLRDLGPFELKGALEPISVYELQGVGQMRTRLDLSRARGFSRFVGRGDEMETLETALARAVGGNGQVVGVVAEAGVGKSRLCMEFTSVCRARGIGVYEAHCMVHGRSIPFLPLLELLRDLFDVSEREEPHSARRKVAGELTLLGEGLRDLLPLVFEFLGVAEPDQPPLDLPPDVRKEQLFAFVQHLIRSRAEREPSVLLVDDLHWIDPGSDEFVARIVEAVAGTRTLLLVNFRPEYRAEWVSRSWYNQLPLVPLGPEATRELLESLLGTDPSLDELHAGIADRTAGNPFFTEEVAHGLVESGALEGERGAYRLVRPVGEIELPATVQTVLAARIDRLAEREKQVLHTAAVIGRTFSGPLLQSVVELPRNELAEALSALESGEFVRQEALYPRAEYAFKHPLTQEVALGTQLKDRRARAHAAVARAIEEEDAARLDEHAPLIAHHWAQAGEALEAARWERRAAEWVGFNDLAESLRHSERVLELTVDLTEPAAVELGLEATNRLLGAGAQQGVPLERAEPLLERGRLLAERSGDRGALPRILQAYGSTRVMDGDARDGLRWFEEAAELSAEAPDRSLHAGVLSSCAWARLSLGRPDEALAALTSDEHEEPFLMTGTPQIVWVWVLRSWVLCEMGRLRESARATDRARQVRSYDPEDPQHRMITGFSGARVLVASRQLDGAPDRSWAPCTWPPGAGTTRAPSSSGRSSWRARTRPCSTSRPRP
jgi:class 3 adenylate cyclase/tetratricopeptide (TPR) repeat protein